MPLVSFYTPKTSETWKLILAHLMYYSIIVFREKGNSFSTHSPGMFLYFNMAPQVCFFISTWLPRYVSLFQYGSTRSSNEKFDNSVARGYRVNKFISKFDSY